MNDLEMTKLCAEAMELHPSPYGEDRLEIVTWHGPDGEHPTYHIYDPLHDDAQAMALVKKFGLVCDPQHDGQDFERDPGWEVSHHSLPENYLAISPCLNRAIVECVAKMQQARK